MTGLHSVALVALEHADAEPLRPDCRRGILHLLRAGKKIAERTEIIRVGAAGVEIEERVGREQKRAVLHVNQHRDHAVMQRRGIKKRAQAAHQRNQQAGGQAEAVEERQRVEHPVVVLEIADGEHLADVREKIGVTQLHALRHAFRAACEKHDRGRLRIAVARAGEAHQAGPCRQLPRGADLPAHVLDEDELDAGFGHELDLQPGLFHERAGGHHMRQSGQPGARQQGRRAAGEIEQRRHLAERPEAQERHRRSRDVRQEHAHANGLRRQQPPQLSAQQRGGLQQAAEGELLCNILDHAKTGPLPGGGGDGPGHGARAKRHFSLELLFQHPVAQPVGQPFARLSGAKGVELRRSQERAEMNRDPGEQQFPVPVGGEGQPMGAAQKGRDDPGGRAVEQEAGPVEELHEAARGGDAALGEKDEPSAGLQVFHHVLHSVGRQRIHGKRPAVDQDPSMKKQRLGGGRGGDEAPVGFEAHADEQPVKPRQVVWQQKHRPGRLQHAFVDSAEPEQQPEEQADDPGHGRKAVVPSAGNDGRRPGASSVSRCRCRAPDSHSTPARET